MVVADVKEVLSLISDLYNRREAVNDNDEELIELIDDVHLMQNVFETKQVPEEALKRYKRLFEKIEKLVKRSRNPIRRWINAQDTKDKIVSCHRIFNLYLALHPR